MNNLKNEGPEIVEAKSRSFNGWLILLGLLLVAVLALAPTLLGQADTGGAQGRPVDVTFTKWITTPPDMVGVVGGEVGTGKFSGEIQGMTNVGNITNLEAVYHVNGSLHSFTAIVQAVQDNKAGTGVITGKITEGWLSGMSLTGKYVVLTECPIETLPVNYYGTMCFQGTLHVVPGL